jgi:hypothetical protein
MAVEIKEYEIEKRAKYDIYMVLEINDKEVEVGVDAEEWNDVLDILSIEILDDDELSDEEIEEIRDYVKEKVKDLIYQYG